jgi:hypothetical protein
MRNSAWIWFVGCAVWAVDGAVRLQFGQRAHAQAAIMLAMLFLVAGIYYRRQRR